MKVVFLKDASGAGRKGEVKEFSDGYARNFLIAKGFAVAASDEILRKIQNEQKQQQAKEHKEQERNLKIKNDLDKRTFAITVKVGNKGQVFGSVHEKDVADRIKEKAGYEIDKKQVTIPKHIKELGEYEIEIKLSNGVIAKPKIKLTA